jgi:hypothetical protein
VQAGLVEFRSWQKNSMRFRANILLSLVLLFVACARGPERCSTDKALFEDNFNDTACGWDEFDEEGASAAYGISDYMISVHQPNTSAVAVPGARFSDVLVEAEVQLQEGSADNNFGLLCRYQDLDHFYAFLISSDGYYAIVRVVGGEDFQVLSGDGLHLMPSEAIDTEQGATNEIRALCQGDNLTLFVNGRQLASVLDSQLGYGDVGFIASSYGEAPVRVHFDNMVVLDPAIVYPQTD